MEKEETLEKILELGSKEIEKKPVENPLTMPKEYTKEMGAYAAQKLDIKFTEKLLNKLNKKTIYLSSRKEVEEHISKAKTRALKKPSTWLIPAIPLTFSIPFYFMGILNLSSILLTYAVGFLAGYGLCCCQFPPESNFDPMSKRVRILSFFDQERIGLASHEFTHFLHNHLKKRDKNTKKNYRKNRELKEGIARKVQIDSLYDYGSKELADFRSLHSLLKAYATLGGEGNNKSKQLFKHCNTLLSKVGITNNKFYKHSLKKIKNKINKKKKYKLKRKYQFHSIGYARTLLEMEKGKTLPELAREGFSFDI